MPRGVGNHDRRPAVLRMSRNAPCRRCERDCDEREHGRSGSQEQPFGLDRRWFVAAILLHHEVGLQGTGRLDGLQDGYDAGRLETDAIEAARPAFADWCP